MPAFVLWLRDSDLQFEDSKVGKEVVGAVIELLSKIVVKNVEVLRVVSVDAGDELLNVLRSCGGGDPLRCACGF